MHVHCAGLFITQGNRKTERPKTKWLNEGTENAGPENGVLKMEDRITGVENGGPENGGPLVNAANR